MLTEQRGALCALTFRDHNIRHYSLKEATAAAVDAWLAHLTAWYYELTLQPDVTDVRIVLDLRECGDLPGLEIVRGLARWARQHKSPRRRQVAIIHSGQGLKALAAHLANLLGPRHALQFFDGADYEQALHWLGRSAQPAT